MPWPPQTLRIKKCKNSIIQNLLPECTKIRIFRCNFAKFSRGHAPGPPRMVVPSVLPLKLICDVTRLWRNLAFPSEIFCVRHWPSHGILPNGEVVNRTDSFILKPKHVFSVSHAICFHEIEVYSYAPQVIMTEIRIWKMWKQAPNILNRFWLLLIALLLMFE